MGHNHSREPSDDMQVNNNNNKNEECYREMEVAPRLNTVPKVSNHHQKKASVSSMKSDCGVLAAAVGNLEDRLTATRKLGKF